MTQPALSAAAQAAAPEPYVVLFDLDATVLGGSVYRFSQSSREAAPIRFGGHDYVPVDVEVEGFEWAGRGPLPSPTLKVGNVNRVFSALLSQCNDLLGATLIRTRTLRQFLDDAEEADPTAHFPLDVYKIERKTLANKVFVQWELSASLDQEGRMLPGRQVLRDTCTHRYRRWTGSAFDYVLATCPYAGTAGFNAMGSPTTSAKDVCGKRLSDCRLRFGQSAVLPTRSFPGVARVHR